MGEGAGHLIYLTRKTLNMYYEREQYIDTLKTSGRNREAGLPSLPAPVLRWPSGDEGAVCDHRQAGQQGHAGTRRQQGAACCPTAHYTH